jgi:hypothetical protein
MEQVKEQKELRQDAKAAPGTPVMARPGFVSEFDESQVSGAAAGLFEQNHLVKTCVKNSIPETDPRHKEALDFGRIYPVNRIGFGRFLGEAKGALDRVDRQYRVERCSVNDHCKRKGTEPVQVFAEFHKWKPQLDSMVKSIEELAAKLK